MNDGNLLHCLALERHEFQNRYHLARDDDQIHKGSRHYFQTSDEFKSAISEHNRKHQAFIKELKEASFSNQAVTKLLVTSDLVKPTSNHDFLTTQVLELLDLRKA